MKHISKVEIVLENTESIELPIEVFEEFNLTNISTEIRRIACNAVSRFNLTKKVNLTIPPEGNIEYTDLAGDKQKVFDRLLVADIVSFELTYEDNSKEEYFVDYIGDEINFNEKVKLQEDGGLLIEIG